MWKGLDGGQHGRLPLLLSGAAVAPFSAQGSFSLPARPSPSLPHPLLNAEKVMSLSHKRASPSLQHTVSSCFMSFEPQDTCEVDGTDCASERLGRRPEAT